MRELFGCIRAELVKMRHTFLYPLHLALPVLGSALFLLYYRVSGWSEEAQISGYAQVIGIALPFAVSIVCAGNVELEEKNHFQTFLGGAVRRRNSFLAKLLTLLGLGGLAVLGAVFFFGAGYGLLPGREGISPGVCLSLGAVLWMGSIPLYLEHLFLNLMFAKQVSLCVSVAQFLLSALFLTGLGDGRWLFFPCTWSARGATLFLAGGAGRAGEQVPGELLEQLLLFSGDIKNVFPVFLAVLVLLCGIIGIWFRFYEGRKCND